MVISTHKTKCLSQPLLSHCSNLFPTIICHENFGSFSSNTSSATFAAMCPTSTTGLCLGHADFIPKYRIERVNICKTKSDRATSHQRRAVSSPVPANFPFFFANRWQPTICCTLSFRIVVRENSLSCRHQVTDGVVVSSCAERFTFDCCGFHKK